jgi:Response regulator containing a CheY-like receiver domain and an HTH DNA-binding domain
LTEREHAVARLIAKGKRTRDIADVLGVSLSTVDTHRANLGRKLRTNTPAQLLIALLKEGLVKIPGLKGGGA